MITTLTTTGHESWFTFETDVMPRPGEIISAPDFEDEEQRNLSDQERYEGAARSQFVLYRVSSVEYRVEGRRLGAFLFVIKEHS